MIPDGIYKYRGNIQYVITVRSGEWRKHGYDEWNKITESTEKTIKQSYYELSFKNYYLKLI